MRVGRLIVSINIHMSAAVLNFAFIITAYQWNSKHSGSLDRTLVFPFWTGPHIYPIYRALASNTPDISKLVQLVPHCTGLSH